MEIYADPRAARAATRAPRGPGAAPRARPGHPPPGCGRVQTSLHGARSAHSRSERRRQVASFDGDAAGAPGPPLGRLDPRPSSRGAGAGRSEQMRITPHTYYTRTFTTCLGTTIPTASLHTSNLCGASGHDFIGRDPRTLLLSQPSCFTW